MSLQHAAQLLAAQGRHGDSHLVHMSSGEIRGLQDLAKLHGTSLTTNPHTGLPEAFSLKSLLPAILGAGIVAATGGAAAPWMVGAGIGGLEAMRTGSLSKGLSAGLGAYGGAGLGAALAETGASSLASEAAGAGGATPVDPVSGVQGGTPANPWASTAGEGAAQGAAQAPMTTEQIRAMAPEAGAADVQGFQQSQGATQGISQAAPSEYQPQVGQSLGDIKTSTPMLDQMSAGAKSLGRSIMDGTGSSALNFAKDNAKSIMAAASPVVADALTPAAPPVVPVDKDLGRRYSYLPGRTSPTPSPSGTGVTQQYFAPSYGTISSDEAKRIYGFADGGMPSSSPMPGAHSPVEQMSEANSLGKNTGFPTADIQHGAYATPWQDPLSRNMVHNSTDSNVDMFTGEPTGLAAGGIARYGWGGLSGDSEGMLGKLIGKLKEAGAFDGGAQQQKFTYNPGTQTYKQAALASGGLSDLGGYSDGGRLLRGPGDGVSDSIPAVIGKKQPARLADGEFVVPARIVSELGNGSTEAGARKLYAMMNRVQSARGKTVGKDRVARNTRADKYLPA